MKDIHSHILFGIDDGAKTIEESIEILDKLYENGVTDIILTPHYIKGSKYNTNNKDKMKILKKLKSKYKKINLYIGNEVYIDNDLLSLIKSGEVSTLNKSSYLLMELPMNNTINDLDIIVYDLLRNGINPIIAHPERYSYVQNNIFYLDRLLNMGVLFQGNYESLFGKYGHRAKKTLIKLLKKNYISFLGSDIHHNVDDLHIRKLHSKLKRIVKEENKVNDLIDGNITKVINNLDISE